MLYVLSAREQKAKWIEDQTKLLLVVERTLQVLNEDAIIAIDKKNQADARIEEIDTLLVSAIRYQRMEEDALVRAKDIYAKMPPDEPPSVISNTEG